jgi:DNA-binding CsgD family transcriptional regulator
MQMVRSKSHLELFQTNEERMQQFIRFQGLSSINYFGFYRFYDSGEALLLSTNSSLMRNRIEQGISLHSEPSFEYLRANRLIDMILVNQNSQAIVQQEYQLLGNGHSVIYFHFHKEFYDVFHFSICGTNDEACKSLVCLMPAFQHIAHDFLLIQSDLINNSELVAIPFADHVGFRRRYYNSKIQLYIRERQNMIHVSPQESQVMRLYASGYQAKEGARAMDISSRTYKSYLFNLGLKLGGMGKELVKIARENYLV